MQILRFSFKELSLHSLCHWCQSCSLKKLNIQVFNTTTLTTATCGLVKKTHTLVDVRVCVSESYLMCVNLQRPQRFKHPSMGRLIMLDKWFKSNHSYSLSLTHTLRHTHHQLQPTFLTQVALGLCCSHYQRDTHCRVRLPRKLIRCIRETLRTLHDSFKPQADL